MKTKLFVLLALLTPGLALNAAPKESEWVRIPSKWLLHRFVRPSTAPAHTYRVALVVPAGSNKARVAQSCGSSDVDALAGDFALESIRNNGALKALAKSKELYFPFIITPPMLDVKMRSKEGQRPPPPGKEIYTPISDSFFFAANQNETAARSGELAVIFPPQGGYASEAIVTTTTGNPAVDRYHLHTAALNWQTTRKSSQPQVYRTPYGARKPTRWESVLDQ